MVIRSMVVDGWQNATTALGGVVDVSADGAKYATEAQKGVVGQPLLWGCRCSRSCLHSVRRDG
eukprot:29273-Pelagomonas_calceolata.AAC.2